MAHSDAQQTSLFYNRKRRKRRHQRAGVGFVNPTYRVAPGTAISSPVSVAEGLLPVTLVFTFEYLGAVGAYPNGTLLGNDELAVTCVTGGTITVEAPATPAVSFSTDQSDIAEPHGGLVVNEPHTICVVLDPPGDRAGLYLDGKQTAQDTGSYTLWSDGLADWVFMDSVDNVGIVGDLEIFIGFIPPTFVA